MKSKLFVPITFRQSRIPKPTYLAWGIPLYLHDAADWAIPTCDRANAIWRRAHTL